MSLLEVVNTLGDSAFYIRGVIPDNLRETGRRTLKAFNVKSRFVHFEFFCLKSDQHIGKKGDIVALEVNMRPSGGISPTMMNYANSVDVYKIWADMIAFDKLSVEYSGEHCFCAFAGIRDGLKHKMSAEQIHKKYGSKIVMEGRVEEALSGAMGNYMYVVCLHSEKELNTYYKDLLKLA